MWIEWCCASGPSIIGRLFGEIVVSFTIKTLPGVVVVLSL